MHSQGPDVRFNPATEEWVIIAAERAARPRDAPKKRRRRRTQPDFDANCPFCPGNEHQTPSATLELPGAEPGAWRLRVVPNKYPALSPSEELRAPKRTGMFRYVPAWGRHEVLVETPLHNRVLADRDETEIGGLLSVYQERYQALRALDGVKYVLVFKNQGAEAGTSLVHPHSQIIAAPVVPERQKRMETIAARHHRRTKRCLYCDMAEQEIQDARRVIYRDELYVVFHPFASTYAAETLIAPLAHAASFASADRAALGRLGSVLLRTLRQLRAAFDDPDYNFAIRSGRPGVPHYHWHLQLIPRLTRAAGLELASGMYINPLSPEEAANRMRSTRVPEP
jgi:UDPglucose--hexose-1-phosphate uridylyltransferase